jgi:hypothetical protein
MPVSRRNPHCIFAFYSLILALVFELPQTRHSDSTIRCKKCRENIPAPVGTMPDSGIAAQCPLCGAKRNNLPSEIFQGNLSHRLGPEPEPRCTVGRDEASHYARAGGLGGANARADENEVDTGHCRHDHSGRSSGPRPGYTPPFTSSHRRGHRQREPGANDFGSSGQTVRW